MTAAQLFLRQMLWRPLDSAAPEPVVALLGPRGSGKSVTLAELSRECGGSVVHGTLDFAEHSKLDPVSAVAFVAFLLMRGWTNLRTRPTFHRLGLCLLALNEPLDRDRAAAEAQINARIGDYVRGTRLSRAGKKVPDLLFDSAEVAAAVSGITGTPQGAAVRVINQQTKAVIGTLLHGAVRLTLRKAMRWHTAVPEAENANTVDSLIALSTTHRGNALNYVMRALLADIDAFVQRHRPARASCDCLLPAQVTGGRHDHAWVLFLDHAQTEVGERFLSALVTARRERAEEREGKAPHHDPLLVIAAMSEWNSAWSRWCEPWHSGPAALGRPRIPLFSVASRDEWLRHVTQMTDANVGGDGRSWYPVWLDPRAGGAAVGFDLAPAWDPVAVQALVSRLGAGHPQAAIDIRARVNLLGTSADSDDRVPRSVLSEIVVQDGTPLWEDVVRDCSPHGLLPTKRPWPTVPAAIAVAAHLGYPSYRSDDLPIANFPGAAQLLRGLRTNLWISTFSPRPSPLWWIGRDTAQPEPTAVLHPWPARCLFAGLAAESDVAEPHTAPTGEATAPDSGDAASRDRTFWDGLFVDVYAALRAPGRGDRLFRDLAQGKFAAVVAELVAQFDGIEHASWVRLLDDATSAPCRLPETEPLPAAYRRLVPDHVPGRGPVEAAVTSLTALLWLLRDPLTVPDPAWNAQIRTDFTKLESNSGRSDVGALHEAARQF